MNFTGSLRRFDGLLRQVAVLAGSLVLCASIPQLSAQSPRFISGSTQPLPGTTTQTYSFTNVASDRSGNVYVVEFDLGSVQKLPAGGSQLQPVDVSGVTRATAIAVDKGGDLLIANDSATPGGQPTSTIILLTPGGAQSTLGSGWITPKGVATDDLGNVYVLDAGPNSTAPAVYEIPSGTNTQVQLPIIGLGDPEGLAADPAGNVFVMDHSSGNLYELPAGASAPLTLVAGLSGAWGVAADIAGNVFYPNGGSIDEIPAGSTTPIRAWQAGNTYVASLGYIAVDGNGKLYFDAQSGADFFIASVQHSSVDFGSAEICVPGWNSLSACTATQTLWLASPSANLPTVQLWAGAGPSTDFSGSSGGCSASSSSIEYICAFNVTYSPKHSGVSSAALVVRDVSGNVASNTLLNGMGNGPQVIYSPESQSTVLSLSGLQEVAVDASGNIFATQRTTGRVLKFPVTGAGIPIGTGFGYPYGLAVTPAGEVFVADALYNQLVKIGLDGSKTVISQNLTTPTGVALDKSGNVYVADQGDNRIVKISAISNHQSTVGGGGWSNPIAVAVDGQGNIYAADGPSNNGTHKVTMLNASTGATTTLSSSFIAPCGLAVDAAGDVYVGDNNVGSVTEILAGGTSQVRLGTGLSNVCGVSVDAGGNVYVADNGNSRIVKLGRDKAPSFAFVSTKVNTTSSDSPKSVQITNIGNAPLVAATGLSNATNFAETSSSTGNNCGSSFWLEPGVSCEMSFSFTPTTAGPLTSADLIALNANPDSVMIQLSGTGVDSPTTIIALSGSGQTTTYGSNFPAPLQVLVLNSAGIGVANVPVTFSGNGVRLSSATVLTSATGFASVTASAIQFGTLSASASIAGVSSPATFSETATKATLQVNPGVVYWDYNQPIVLTQFILSGVTNGDKITGAPALSTTAHQGSPVGPYTITATVGTLVVPPTYNVVFNAGRLIIDTPASIRFSPAAAQSSPLGTPFASPLGIQIAGTVGEALAGVPIAFTSPSMTFSSATVITPSSGAVAVTATPTAIGNLAARATVVGTSFLENFSEFGTVPASATFTISSGSGQTAVTGTRFALPLAVLVADKSGHPLANAKVSFTGTGAQIFASTVKTNASGIASTLAAPSSAGKVSVTATLVDIRSKTVTFNETGK